MRLHLLLIILFVYFAMNQGVAQELVWDLDFNTVFANREGGDGQTPDQTFLFTRLSPTVGVQFTDHRQNNHRFMGGVTWFQPLNDNLEGYRVLPTLYYQGSARNWQLTLGAFPRHLMRHELPRYLWSDSLNYCTSIVRGVMLQYDSPEQKRWLQTYIDWRQMQSLQRREAFNLVLSGGFDLGKSPLYALGHIQYNHLAKRKNAPEDEGVNDDATINPMLGCRFPIRNVHCKVEGGAIIQLQRCRAEDRWHTPSGFIGNLYAHWRWIDFSETFFVGKDLFPLYDFLGSELNLGDPYYRNKLYSRTDLRAHIFNNTHVDVSAVLTFHATDRVTGFWQQLSCRFYMNGSGKTVNKGQSLLSPTF